MMMVCVAGFCIVIAAVSDAESCCNFFQTPCCDGDCYTQLCAVQPIL